MIPHQSATLHWRIGGGWKIETVICFFTLFNLLGLEADERGLMRGFTQMEKKITKDTLLREFPLRRGSANEVSDDERGTLGSPCRAPQRFLRQAVAVIRPESWPKADSGATGG